MTAGLINIASYGANELYLTGNPQITFFKIVYRRYTNFSNENIIYELNGLEFGQENEFVVPKIGDTLGQITLQIQLPMFSLNRFTDLGFLDNTIEQQTALTAYSTAKTNYQIVTDFMSLNIGAYNAAYNTSLASNITVNDIITSINTFYTNYKNNRYINYNPPANQLKVRYNNLLINSMDSEIENNLPFTSYYMLNPQSTDIFYNNNYQTYTDVPSIMTFLNQCLFYSSFTQQYYYNILKTSLAILMDVTSPNAKMAWVKNIAFSIIDYISVYIGGQEIDRHDGDWLNVWYQLSGNPNQKEIFDKLIGNIFSLTNFDRNTKPSYLLSLPLSFWFCRNIGSTIPLIALQNSDVRINFRLKKIQDCMYIEKNPSNNSNVSINLFDLWQNNGYFLSGSYLIDYYYLDKIERRRFAQSAHEYLIEIIENENRSDISLDENVVNYQMNFTGPSKELIWFFRKNAYVSNTTNYYQSLWGNYGINKYGAGNIMTYSSMHFGSYELLEKTSSIYSNLVQPLYRHTNSAYDGIYMYNFGFCPEQFQPSGTANLSKINATYITFYIDPSAFIYYDSDIDPTPNADSTTQLTTDLTLNIYSFRYTVLRIIGGFGSLAFQ